MACLQKSIPWTHVHAELLAVLHRGHGELPRDGLRLSGYPPGRDRHQQLRQAECQLNLEIHLHQYIISLFSLFVTRTNLVYFKKTVKDLIFTQQELKCDLNVFLIVLSDFPLGEGDNIASRH